MVDSKFFGIPFAVSGDKATIPEDTQPSGAISYQQGYGPDYERDPETDPLAKRVPRDETNELYYQITNAMRFLQLYGTPEWYAVDDNGDPVSYPITARVRHDAGAGMQAWRSLVAANTTEPGNNPAHWTPDEPFSFAALEASLAEAIAGTLGSKLITPRRLASSVLQTPWAYANASGTPTAITANLSPAITSYSQIFGAPIRINLASLGPSGAAPTINLNGLGVVSVKASDGNALVGGEMQGVVTLIYDGTVFQLATQPRQFRYRTVFTSSGDFVVPAWCRRVKVTVTGGGGRGSNCQANGGNFISGGGGGAAGTAIADLTVIPGATIAATVGLGAAPSTGISGPGGTSSFSGVSATGGGSSTFFGGTDSPGGPGGSGSGGDINVFGGSGGDGQSGSFLQSGLGGASFWGGGGRAASGGGVSGRAIGSGGGGAYDASISNIEYLGGGGADGVVIVEF